MASRPADSTPDSIRTVSNLSTASVLVLGSKFLAALGPASTDSELEELLHLRRSRYHDASHHCWAYRGGRPGPIVDRSADDGEPSGTAGRPILDTLRGHQIENAACIVSRYFGGTKLGTGGLVRAYADATLAVIAEATIHERTIARLVHLDFAHERTGVVYRVLEEFGIRFHQDQFDECAHGWIEVPHSRVASLRARLNELARTGINWIEKDLRLI